MAYVSLPSPDSSSQDVSVASVAALRTMAVFPYPDASKTYVTRNYAVSSDAGGWSYRWNATDTATDDGVLHIKNSRHATGRFQPIRPVDGIMSAQAVGPALADVGTIVRSFDPTGTVASSDELYRITFILRNNGWSGISFGQDRSGNGTYKFTATSKIAGSTLPYVSFAVRFEAGAACVGVQAHSGIGIWAVCEGGLPVWQIVPYAGTPARTWTQTIVGAETIFPAVANITGLAVGDWMLMRIGAEATDADGSPAMYFYGQIRSITPGAGTTGTIETWQCVPEKVPATAGINLYRTQTHHDMIKMIEFQDDTRFECSDIRNIFLAPTAYRNLVVDGVWSEMGFACVDVLVGFGMTVPRMVVKKTTDSDPGGGCAAILASAYSTHIGHFEANITGQSEPGGVVFQALSEESSCRGTRVDYADITYNAQATSPAIFCGQTPNQIDYISVGTLVIRGGFNQFLASNNVRIDVLDIKCGDNQVIWLRADQVGTLIHRGAIYRTIKSYDLPIPIPTGAGSTSVTLPLHGITRSLRILPTTLAGVSNLKIDTIDFQSLMTAGQWSNCDYASLLTGVNGPGYNTVTLTFDTNGTTPAGNALHLTHEIFQVDLAGVVTTVTDTSAPMVTVSAGAPAANATRLGEERFDITNAAWYKSVQVGTGATDWKKLTP